MAVTLTANYKEIFKAETVEKVEELLDENFDLTAILEFIDENSEEDFINYYEEYVRCGEAIGYEAVDALVQESGLHAIENCDERYHGCYSDTAEFAEEYITEVHGGIPDFVVVDWEATYDQNWRYDFTACDDGSSYRSVHIFSDN